MQNNIRMQLKHTLDKVKRRQWPKTQINDKEVTLKNLKMWGETIKNQIVKEKKDNLKENLKHLPRKSDSLRMKSDLEKKH